MDNGGVRAAADNTSHTAADNTLHTTADNTAPGTTVIAKSSENIDYG